MEVDVWFKKQHIALQIALLLIPVVGWIVDLLVRLSLLLKTSHVYHIGSFVVVLVFGWLWAPVALDAVSLILSKKIIFEEIKK